MQYLVYAVFDAALQKVCCSFGKKLVSFSHVRTERKLCAIKTVACKFWWYKVPPESRLEV